MRLGKYGLEDPCNCRLSYFEEDQEYILGYFDEYKNFNTHWLKVIQASQPVKLKSIQERANISYVRFGDEKEAIIDNEVKKITPIGFFRVFEEYDIVVFGGRINKDDETKKVVVHSREKINNDIFDDYKTTINMEFTYENLKANFKSNGMRNNDISINGKQYTKIEELKVDDNSWLQNGLQLYNLNLFVFNTEGEAESFDFI